MSKRIPSLLATGLFAALASCSYVPPGSVNQPAELAKAKSVYVIRENPDNEVGVYIESALAQKGLRVSSGKLAAKPKTTDLYIDYVDRWDWDLVMYLKSLDVTLHSNRTGELLASGNFHQGFLHTFPDTRAKTKEVIDTILPDKGAAAAPATQLAKH
jgi:hypothetical protein